MKGHTKKNGVNKWVHKMPNQKKEGKEGGKLNLKEIDKPTIRF